MFCKIIGYKKFFFGREGAKDIPAPTQIILGGRSPLAPPPTSYDPALIRTIETQFTRLLASVDFHLFADDSNFVCTHKSLECLEVNLLNN